ncbi:MAG: aspartate aminotransferase family protein [Candidatus Eremiobacter antarcticus]|nr:aspartate aminotransferase family protein [Candidatus Eremiobacteraeota bacterium]MBC5807872.1 aspartate aminotransferase family protein [Candidatus Eremiobacteraeota bacterium]PZR62757.1 MAG: aspartate aminotransferase family protein [Candidatus Eremiobacter sp. RRmetagenome_bin22]
MSEDSLGGRFADINISPPGPNSRRLSAQLHTYESRNITYVSDEFPIFLSDAHGANIVDVDGNVYVDLTGAFGVAAAGHSNPQVVEAMAAQARRLFHGMGDVYPTENRLALAKLLCGLTPGEGAKRVIFAATGAEAVEAALKTAAIASGKPGVICFTDAYHGLSYGTLPLTDRDEFKAPLRAQLAPFAVRAPYPNAHRCPLSHCRGDCDAACLAAVRALLDGPKGADIGAVIVEAVAGRGGVVPAPAGWLQGLREMCDERSLVLIVDEIFTGFGRTGRWFACERAGIVPDLLCLGKGMSSGFPIAACVGKAEIMDRWPLSGGEAMHTGTFLGHPAGCAAALASIAELRKHRLAERAAELEGSVRSLLQGVAACSDGRISDIRGCGLLWGLECTAPDGGPDAKLAAEVMREAMINGVLILTCGPHRNVISLSPPLTISLEQLRFCARVLESTFANAVAAPAVVVR